MANREAKFTITADNKASAVIGKLTGDLGGLKGVLGGIAKAAAPALAIFASGAAIKGFANLIQHSNELTDSLRDSSQRLGIGVAQLQAYQLAAGNAGIGNEGLEKSISKLNKASGDLKNGFADMTGSTGKAFSALGIGFDEIRKSTPDVLFEKVVDGLAKIEDPARRASVAMALFGKSGASVLTLVHDGVSSLAESRKLLDDFGVSLTEIDANKVDAANDALNNLGTIATAAKQKLGAELAPAITAVANTILETGENGGFNIGKFIHDGVEIGVTAIDRLILAAQTIYFGFQTQGEQTIGIFSKIAAAAAGLGASIIEAIGGSGVDAFNKLIDAAEKGGSSVASGINSIMAVVVAGVNAAVNSAIEGVEKLINATVEGLNTIIRAANAINPVGSISEIGGVSLGRASISAPQLPTGSGVFPRIDNFGQGAAGGLRDFQNNANTFGDLSFESASENAGKAADAFGKLVGDGGELQKNFDAATASVDGFTKAVGNGVDGDGGGKGAGGAMKKLGKETEKTGKLAANTFNFLETAAKSVMSNMEKAIDDFVKTGKFSFSDFAASVLRDLAAILLKTAILGGIFGASSYGGSGGGLFGSLINGIGGGGAFAGAYGIPKAIPVSYDGGGFTGGGSRAGGVDGKGGFFSILHPNETVLDHTKGQTGSSVTVQQTVIVRETLSSGIAAQIANAATSAAMANIQSINSRGGLRRKSFGLGG